MKMMGFAGLNPSYELHVIARSAATKQSILSLRGKMDCFASLAMTARAMDCFAEPVIGRAFARPALRGEAANACLELPVIASAAKQSILYLLWRDGLLRFARKDDARGGLLRFARDDD
jgi:hypothetical protein